VPHNAPGSAPRHVPAHRARRVGRTHPPSNRRSIRVLPSACAMLRPWVTPLSPPGRPALFKRHHFPPLRTTRAAAFHCRRRWACSSARSRRWRSSHLSPRTRRTSSSHVLSSVLPSSPEPRAAAAAAVGHRRTPTPATPPPEPRPPTHPRWACTWPRAVPRPGAPPELPDFRRARRPVDRGTQLHGLEFFQGPSSKDASSIVYSFCRNLKKNVENCRNFRKMPNKFYWICCGKYYNFCYTLMVWFLIVLAWKIGMWKT
jgi:hypothetical protein